VRIIQKTALTMIPLLALAGCGRTGPSPKEAKQAIKDQINAALQKEMAAAGSNAMARSMATDVAHSAIAGIDKIKFKAVSCKSAEQGIFRCQIKMAAPDGSTATKPFDFRKHDGHWEYIVHPAGILP